MNECEQEGRQCCVKKWKEEVGKKFEVTTIKHEWGPDTRNDSMIGRVTT